MITRFLFSSQPRQKSYVSCQFQYSIHEIISNFVEKEVGIGESGGLFMAASANPVGNKPEGSSTTAAAAQKTTGNGTSVNSTSNGSGADCGPTTAALRHNSGISLEWSAEEQTMLEDLLVKYVFHFVTKSEFRFFLASLKPIVDVWWGFVVSWLVWMCLFWLIAGFWINFVMNGLRFGGLVWFLMEDLCYVDISFSTSRCAFQDLIYLWKWRLLMLMVAHCSCCYWWFVIKVLIAFGN